MGKILTPLLAALWTFVAVFTLGQMYLSRLPEPEPPVQQTLISHRLTQIPRCALEDGSDVEGICVWIDPDTGNVYINPTEEETK